MRIFCLLICALTLPLNAQVKSRNIQPVAFDKESLGLGTFHYLGIGIDQYRDSDLVLNTAVSGAESLRDLLIEEYIFEKTNTRTLLDHEATRAGIIRSLRQLAIRAKPEDSVLIYYAGHGHLDKKLTQTGSWVPWEANFQTPERWISNEEIKVLLASMRARHVLLISDSCFAGNFFRGSRSLTPKITDRKIRKAFNGISRRAMTSGGLEPVTDGGKDGQSVYTWWLLNTLKESTVPYLLPEQIHDRLKRAVPVNARQDPLFGLLHDTGGEPDASFVFFRKGTDSLDAAVAEKERRLAELSRMEREADRNLRDQQALIAQKRAKLKDLDRKLAQAKINAGTDDSSDLNGILEELDGKKERARQLLLERERAEAELRVKQLALLEAQQKRNAERRMKFDRDYANYFKIANHDFSSAAVKQEAWDILCATWDLDRNTPLGTKLVWRDNRVATVMKRQTYQPGDRRVETILGKDFAFRWMPPGSFMMGSPQSEPGRGVSEVLHKVNFRRGFWILENEITQSQYEVVMDANPSSNEGPLKPVGNISWNNAKLFITKLNRLLDKDLGSVGLPTEAQWEYACRAGSNTPYAGELDLMGWYRDNTRGSVQNVRMKAPNAWGMYDMHGNVWEWCQDWLGHYDTNNPVDPQGPKEGDRRILRGGSWGEKRDKCRSALRSALAPDTIHPSLGFRIVLYPPSK